ncbi:MAG: HlyD family secretion protein [Acidiphilium sp.]|nr:HlyD family secretion protein [Acidiphilium sp.]MDD4934318.1 HlyD family secretion protein [Acidiphilium sp.]
MSQIRSPAGVVARDSDAHESGGRSGQTRSEAGVRGRGKLLRPILMIGGVILILLAVLLYWLFTGGSISVTDTYVKAARVNLSTDVSGLVDKVEVRDHQAVKPGQVLFRLDPTRFVVAVDQARARLEEVSQQISAARHGYQAQLAKIRVQQSVVENDRLNYRRYASLVHGGGVTQSDYDNAKYKFEGAQADLEAMQAQAGVDLAKLSGNALIPLADTPQYKAAAAALATAELNYRHSIVRAPFAGVVTETEQLQRGMYLPAGTAAFGLVSSTDIWVRAQPKETALTWVKPGDKVNIHVDTYPGQLWHGVVASISPASGSSFSILPAQNSSGNWVKVVQRIPLRVNITSGPKNLVLRNGMTAEVDIITGHRHKLSNLF